MCNEHSLSDDKNVTVEKIVWDSSNKDKFLSSIDMNIVDSLMSDLDDISSSNSENVNVDSNINRIVDSVSDLFVNAAKQADMFKSFSIGKKRSGQKSHNVGKPWFDTACRDKRHLYLRAKNSYRKNKSAHNFYELKSSSKNYKKEINKKK